MRKTLKLLSALAVILGALVAEGQHYGIHIGQPGSAAAPSSPTSTPVPGTWNGATPSRGQIRTHLKKVAVVAQRPSIPGYDRDCGTGHACSFGPAWTDDTTAPLGHNGCDQRNDILKASMTDVDLRPGTHGCVVESGTLADPYTGATIQFTKAKAYLVQIDHMFPLARAWDTGAASWSLEERTRFATDPLNLTAVDGSSNASKGDQGPGEWMPINSAYRCTYVDRYLKVAIAYQLPITSADAAAISHTASTCPQKPVPAH